MIDGFIPYGRQSIDATDIQNVAGVLESGWLTTGPAVDKFESDLSGDMGGVNVAAVASGTAALHAAYAGLGIGAGDEVVVTPVTFAATATTAMLLGAKIRFADVSDDTLNLDPSCAAAAVSDSTRVIAAVDYAGHPADMDALRDLAKKSGASLLEDAAHSLGATYKGRPVGTLADVTTFSFHPVKVITTAEGGAVASFDQALISRVKRFRDHGITRNPNDLDNPHGSWHQEVTSFGLNYRLSDVHASLGSSQLNRLGLFLERRRSLANRYAEGLRDLDDLRIPVERADIRSAWHLYVVRVLDGRRAALFDHLRSKGIGVQVHYLPVHLHKLFRDLGYRRGECPVAEAAYEEVVSLPLYPDLSHAEQDRVINEVRTVLE